MACISGEFSYEVINLGESQIVRLDLLIMLLEDALHCQAFFDRQPLQDAVGPMTFIDGTKPERMLGYHPRTKTAEGIRRFAEWFQPSSQQKHV